MVQPSWGLKRSCKKCSANFYDLLKDPIVCPKCSTSFSPSDFVSKYVKNSDKADQRRDKKVSDEEDTDDMLDDDTIVNTDLLEDSEDLDEDLDIIDRDETEEDQ